MVSRIETALDAVLDTVEVIAFDADDTLWHNESLFVLMQERYRTLLSAYHDPEWIDRKLYETEMRNLQHFGYGVKGFTLSMIETAVELTEGRIRGDEIREILGFGKEMLAAPVELLPGVRETIESLAPHYTLLLITKGDLFHQESKVARSGLAEHFAHVEIVSDKTPGVYRAMLDRHGIAPERFLMVGNSLRSDVLPVVEIGGYGLHIPYHTTWAHEHVADAEPSLNGYMTLDSIAGLVQGRGKR